ncbi:hypothetical protein C2S51_014335 [Perilla frutescens var. frutescens]|nr:hypothetical protein C2S51_014335 [Perilla frutescens var. frutescens]
MSEKREQVKPLAPAAHRLDIYDNQSDPFSVELASHLHFHRRQRCIKLCGCSAAVLLIAVTVVLVLMFTVFHVKVPSLTMNAVTIKGVGELNSSGTSVGPGRNVTFGFEVSVKNPNVASFKFSNTTTSLYYDGSRVGENTGQPGEARARKRLRVEVNVGVMVDRLREVGRLKSDLEAGFLSISSYTTISGKVKITGAIKRSLIVKLTCTMNVSVRSQEIQDLDCS